MRFWALILRVLGGAWFVLAMLVQVRWLFEPITLYEDVWIETRPLFAVGVLLATVITAICFAIASGLDHQEQAIRQMSRQSAALARMLMSLPSEIDPKQQRSEEDYQPRPPRAFTDADLAPVAPAWPEIKPRPPEPERDDSYEQRMAQRGRYRVTRKANVRRNIGAIAKDLIEDARDNPSGKSAQRYSSKKRL